MKSLKKQFASIALGMIVLAPGGHAAPFTAGTHYEDNAYVLCSQTDCFAIFSPVPAGQPLLLTGVSCRIDSQDSALFAATLTLGLGHARREILPVGPATTIGTNSVYVMREEVRFYYYPGQRPSVFVSAGVGSSVRLECRITGTRPAPV